VVSQLNAAFGSALQFANAGGMLQVLNAGASTTVNALSATATATTLVNGNAQVPLFTDGSNPITGAISATGSQTVGLAGRITVNPALLASPAGLVAFAAGTAAGDPTRPSFILQQLTAATPTYSALTGIGSAQAPYSGTLPNYLSQVISQQSQAASAASNLQQGQDTVLNALQQRFNDQSGVNIDTEMSNLIALQSAYSANARVMTTVQQLLATLMQVVQ
jgi:flagellar hook-associated protein 1 FlgK